MCIIILVRHFFSTNKTCEQKNLSGEQFTDVFPEESHKFDSKVTSLLENPNYMTGQSFKQFFTEDHKRISYFTKVCSVKSTKAQTSVNVIYSEDGEHFDDTEYVISIPQLLADYILGDIIFED